MRTYTPSGPDPTEPKTSKLKKAGSKAAGQTAAEKAKGPKEKSLISKKERSMPKLGLAEQRRRAEKALNAWQEKFQQGDTHNFSSRIRGIGQTAYKLLEAEHPEKNKTDLLTYIMLVAAALIDTAPRPKFETLDARSYTHIRGAFATLISDLLSFEDRLLEIDLYPDDPQRTENIANLAASARFKLTRIEELAGRLARIAKIPDIPVDPDQYRLLELLAERISELEASSSAKEQPIWTLASKLLAPYLP